MSGLTASSATNIAVSLAKSLAIAAYAVTRSPRSFAAAVARSRVRDASTRIATARAMLHTTAAAKDRGVRVTQYSSMCKLFASETAMYVADEAVQIFGGYGYVTEYPVERYLRDAKVTEIYEGTSEIQRVVIARELYV